MGDVEIFGQYLCRPTLCAVEARVWEAFTNNLLVSIETLGKETIPVEGLTYNVDLGEGHNL